MVNKSKYFPHYTPSRILQNIGKTVILEGGGEEEEGVQEQLKVLYH